VVTINDVVFFGSVQYGRKHHIRDISTVRISYFEGLLCAMRRRGLYLLSEEMKKCPAAANEHLKKNRW
jgi:hypothetical protein